MANHPSWKSVAQSIRSLKAKRRTNKRTLKVERLVERKLLAADLPDPVGPHLPEEVGEQENSDAPSVNEIEFESLDVNSDAIISGLDAILVHNAISQNLTIEDMPAADVDANGVIDQDDFQLVVDNIGSLNADVSDANESAASSGDFDSDGTAGGTSGSSQTGFSDATNATTQTNGSDGSSQTCLLYTSPSPRDLSTSRMPSSA